MDFDFPKLEKKILKFWKDNRIFQKSIERRKNASNFVFYEGPPTANGKPGIHHVLSRVFKDIICRYKTMRGFRVLRKAGWDTHGLPVEIQIEKALGLKNKKDIEKYGIAKFNKKCRESVWQYKKDWEKLTERIAFWLDMENPYITYASDYIETVWWIIKQIFKKGLIYQDYKVVPYCPRCGTSLSSHEVALGYKKIKEPAIYIKFQITNPKFQTEGRTYLLVWTTTPWTLPGNVAIAVNPKFIYVKAKINNDYLVLAKERLSILGKDFEIVKEFEGKELVGLRYDGFYPSDGEIRKQCFRVIPANFVSLEEGTGLVHIAPAFGEEDMELVKMTNSKIQIPNERFPILLPVDTEGKFTLNVKKWAGLFVKDADPLIIEDLKQRNILFKDEIYEHDYPFCWRCNSPLLYYAKQSWFVEMQKVKKELIENNQKINWIPAHLKEGRFGEWLKEIKDWAFSRERYWGTPLPIWQCKTCRNLEVIGSLKDLLSQRFSNNNYFILRHGDSLRQRKKVAMCWPEKIYCPLTKKGEEEVKIAAKKLKKEKIGIIFSSDLLRTKQTAEILSRETGAKIVFNKNLREFNVGIFNGKDPKLAWDHLNIQKSNVVSAKLPRGESLTGVRKRMYGFLKEIDKKYQDKNILIVSHELPLTILEGALRGSSIGEILELRKDKKIKTIKTGELRRVEFKNLPFDAKMELDFHRPYVDEVKFFCLRCKGIMERAPEVIDCWFDSGAMPFGQEHWPFNENPKSEIRNPKPPELFPADYISEAVDQTRGWFYTQLAISTLLGFGTPYKNVISLGHVLDEKGEKMSKSKGNVVDPWYIIGKYGAESTRWYFYTVNQPGDAKLFSEKDVDQALKKFILTLWNCYVFYQTYAIPHFLRSWKTEHKNVLDEWIISKSNTLIKDITQELDNYDVTGAARAVENFVVEDLSLWYIRRSRRRLQKPKTKKELEEASEVLNYILLTVCKLSAPFIPFLSEEIYQKCLTPGVKQVKQSVHLEDWPEANKKLINNQLEKKMLKVREVVTLALAERAKAGIKVRQPLASLKIKNQISKIKKEQEELLNLIREEVNVKAIVFNPKIKKDVELDTEITPELKEEGILREIIRNIQEMRKKANLKPRHKIAVQYFGVPELNKILAKNKDLILRETLAKDFQLVKRGERVFDVEKETKVDKIKLWLAIKKI